MKKLIFASAILIASCNSPKTTETCTDSCTKVCTDSCTKSVDTLNPRGVVDTTILKTVK